MGRELSGLGDPAQSWIEDLGKGVELEMVAIPAGNFLMGSPETEEETYEPERPQYRVNVESFWMGRYPITQGQWAAVAQLPTTARDLDPDPARFNKYWVINVRFRFLMLV